MLENEETSEGITDADVFYGNSEETESTDAVIDNETTEESVEKVEPKAEESEAKEESSDEPSKEETKEEEPEAKDDEVVELKSEDLEFSDVLKEGEQEEILKTVNELGMNKEQAKAYLEAKEAVETTFEERLTKKNEELRESWLKESQSDPDIGGAKLKENAEFSKKAIEEFGSEGLIDFLNASGMGNNKDIIRTFSKIGRAIGNAQRFGGDILPEAQELADHEIFYGKKS